MIMRSQEKIWKTAAVLAAGVISLKAGSILAGNPAEGISAGGLAVYVLPVAVMICLAARLHMTERLEISGEGWGAFFTKGWYVLASSGVLAYLALSSLPPGEALPDTARRALILAAGCLFTAVFEEIWFRGIIQGLLLEGTDTKGKDPWRAICAASALFGAVHLLNLLEKPWYVTGTIVQVLYTFSLGLMLGTIFYQCANIWVCVLLHAVFNLCGTVTEIFVEIPPQSGDMGASSAALLLLLFMPGIIWARFIYKTARER